MLARSEQELRIKFLLRGRTRRFFFLRRPDLFGDVFADIAAVGCEDSIGRTRAKRILRKKGARNY
jgi:hypothetical protein